MERTEKRLRSLENVKPQFVEEAEKLELELQRHYEVYMTKYRNLDYLEHELGKVQVHGVLQVSLSNWYRVTVPYAYVCIMRILKTNMDVLGMGIHVLMLVLLVICHVCDIVETYHKAEEERTAQSERRLQQIRDDLLRAEVKLLRGENNAAGSGTILGHVLSVLTLY